MQNHANATNCSRGVAQNGQEIGLENEFKLLECIKLEGWVREFEASLITGMSMHMLGKVSRRLAAKGQILRKRGKDINSSKKLKSGLTQVQEKKPAKAPKPLFDGNTGLFLRLSATGAERIGGKSGKDITIPAAWRHHAMSIQTLDFLAKKFGCGFETEASLRHRVQTGKLPDGRLISDTVNYYFEQEHSRKSGHAMHRQIEVITQLSKHGTVCHVAFPSPPKICGGLDHQTRLTNSIRHQWGNSAAPSIKLVKCHFDSLLSYQNMRVSSFEIFDLPAMVDTNASKKPQPRVTDQVMGFKWETNEDRQNGMPLRICAVLKYCDEIDFEGTFIEGTADNDHVLKTSGDTQYATGCSEQMTFQEFIHEQQKEIEKNSLGERAMCALQAEREARCLPELD